ncbi:MAG: Rieske (2Fe-2S) protein, partial [Betaproteobacteria bacterium]
PVVARLELAQHVQRAGKQAELVLAYLNRCAHMPAEMDWNPGEFLDADRRLILCSIHGASYDPGTGRCAGGPCGRGALVALDVREEAGRVAWYPSPGFEPVSFT